MLSFVAAADDAIIITTPEPTAITDAYGIIKIIATEVENLNIGLKLVVNRVKNVLEGKKVAERIINISGQFLNLKVEYLGCIYEDPVVPLSVVKQRPFILAEQIEGRDFRPHLVSRIEKTDFSDDKASGGLYEALRKGVALISRQSHGETPWLDSFFRIVIRYQI